MAIWDHVLSPGLALGLALLKTRTAKPVPKLQAMFQALLTSQDCPYPATKSYPLKAPSIQSSMRCDAMREGALGLKESHYKPFLLSGYFLITLQWGFLKTVPSSRGVGNTWNYRLIEKKGS